MRRLQIEISDRAFDLLGESAERDRRAPRKQAGWLLERCLEGAIAADGADRRPPQLDAGAGAV